MTTEVNDMQPGGNTNQAIGLRWGWQTLYAAAPFTAPAMDPNYQYQQVIILLSDGLNTQDRWYGNDTSIVDRCTRQQMTCDNIKAAGITIYTVQVNTDGDPTSTLLQNCASDPEQVLPADLVGRRSSRPSVRSAPRCPTCGSRCSSPSGDFAIAARQWPPRRRKVRVSRRPANQTLTTSHKNYSAFAASRGMTVVNHPSH